MKFILENNTFSFNSNFYQQTKGTAMGTKFAPVYATLTIGYLEVKLYEKVTMIFGNTFRDYFTSDWIDILMIASSPGQNQVVI